MTKEKLEELMKMARQPNSIPIETSNRWTEWVAKPCVTSIMAPREARAILEIAGELMNTGIASSSIIDTILKRYGMEDDK